MQHASNNKGYQPDINKQKEGTHIFHKLYNKDNYIQHNYLSLHKKILKCPLIY